MLKKVLFFVIFFSLAVISQDRVIETSDTITIRNTIFEKYTDDFIIKNNGVLILENCIFRNNSLGSKTSRVIFSNDRIVAPIVNFGKLSLLNCKFENNYSWNTALTDDLKAQVSAGAIANFGELRISNTSFKDNTYQKGHFTIIRNTNIDKVSYAGNDSIYNNGNIRVENVSTTPTERGFLLKAELIENPVSSKAEILVETGVSVSVETVIFDAVGNRVFSISDNNVNGTKIFTWSLLNQAGKRVSSGAYQCRLAATDKAGSVTAKTFMLGVKD